MEQHYYRPFENRSTESATGSRQFTQSGLGWDSRYRSIVSQLDLLIELVQRQPACDLTAQLQRLLDAMQDHIDTENGLMEMVAFPQAIQHGQRHQFICFHTAMLRYRIGKKGTVAPSELAHIRSLWLEHIQVQDRAFEEFLVPDHCCPQLRTRSTPTS